MKYIDRCTLTGIALVSMPVRLHRGNVYDFTPTEIFAVVDLVENSTLYESRSIRTARTIFETITKELIRETRNRG